MVSVLGGYFYKSTDGWYFEYPVICKINKSVGKGIARSDKRYSKLDFAINDYKILTRQCDPSEFGWMDENDPGYINYDVPVTVIKEEM